MWRSLLTVSRNQLILTSFFYLSLIITTIHQFFNNDLDFLTSIVVILLIIEWWRSIAYFLTIKGEFVLFHVINQIYWHHQRFYLIHRPLLLRYMIILNLKSRKNGQKYTLFLMSDNFHPNDWRTLHYHLHNMS